MRVLHVINQLGQGGAEALVAQNVRWLQVRGVRSKIFTVQPEPPGGFFFGPRVREAGVEVISGGGSTASLVRQLLSVVLDWGPSVMHAHLSVAVSVARWIRLLTGVPLVTSLHNLSYEPEILATYRFPDAGRHQLARLLECVVSNAVDDAVVAVGEAVAESARRNLGIDPAKLVVVRNPVDFGALDAQPATSRATLSERLGVPGNGPWVVMTGRVTPQKATLDAVEAFGLLMREQPDARLIVAGGLTDEVYVAQVRERVAALGLEANVFLVGPRKEVAAVLRCADAYLLASRYEGLPLALVEAVGMGAPCVVSDIPSNLEIVRAGWNGAVFPVGDVGALADSLASVLAGRQTFGAGALERMQDARERFSVGRSTEQLLEVYRRVAARAEVSG